MALVIADRVQQTGTANTTVSFTLSGAVTGYQSFAVVGNTNTTYYGATDTTGNWEVGIGTYTTVGTLLTRTTILSSSNAGAAVTFSGTVTVFGTYPSEIAAYASNNSSQTSGQVLTSTGTTTAPTWQTPGSLYTRTSFTATAAQTTFTATYTVGFVQVYQNGVMLNATDYTATSGTSIVLTAAAAAGDIIETIGFNAGSVSFNPASPPAIGNGTPNTIAGTTFTASAVISGSSTTGAYTYGTLSYSDTNHLATYQSSVNSYIQLEVQNTNAGAAASSDIIVGNNNTTATTFYGSLGMNSSGWAGTLGTTSLNAPNVVYLTSTSSDLVIGTTTANAIRFVTNAGADECIIDANGNVGIGITPTGLDLLELAAGTATKAPLGLTAGTNLTTPDAGSVEYDTADTIQYFTGNTTNGRGVTPTVNMFRLLANGAATATTISPFFGATSSIPLVANGVYEIEIECYFTKTTAGTLVWTLTNSAVVTNMVANFQMSPITGVATAGAAPLMGYLVAQTAAAAAFGATGSLTTAVNHWIKFKILLENASSTSLRLNVTNSAGTVTPLRGSYWKATRIPATNNSTYAA